MTALSHLTIDDVILLKEDGITGTTVLAVVRGTIVNHSYQFKQSSFGHLPSLDLTTQSPYIGMSADALTWTFRGQFREESNGDILKMFPDRKSFDLILGYWLHVLTDSAPRSVVAGEAEAAILDADYGEPDHDDDIS